MEKELITNETHYKINAMVVDRDEGMKSFENIRMIRVVSSDHNLLIMEDFMPVIGKIDGTIEIVFGDDIVPYKNIRGFYMHKKNQFYLLIEEYKHVEKTIDEILSAEGEKANA